MLNRISRVLVALVLTVSLVTEPIALGFAVENGVSAEVYTAENTDIEQDTDQEAGDESENQEPEDESVAIAPIEIEKIKLVEGKKVSISWSAVEGAIVNLEKSPNGEEGTWSQIAVGVKEGSYIDANNEYGKTYFYRIVTINEIDGTEIGVSKVAKISTTALNLNAPVLEKPVFTNSNTVKLTWTKIKSATDYEVYRKTGTGSWIKVVTVDGTTEDKIQYVDKNVSTTKILQYKIKPIKDDTKTKSLFSNIQKCHSPFDAVSVKSIVANPGEIVVKWSKVNFATEYKVYRKKSGGNWILKKTVKAGNILKYTDTKVGSRVKYYYKVIPKSDYTVGTKYKVVSKYSKLFKPRVSVSAKGKKYVSLKWKEVTNANVYGVFKSKDGKTWTKVTETKKLKCKISNLATKEKYYFKVRAYCRYNGKNLDYRDSSTLKTATRFNSTDQVIIWRGNTSATIKWASVSGAEKYLVYMSSNDGKTYKKIYSGTSRSITKSGVAKKKTYRFKIYAVDSIGGLETRSIGYVKKSLAPKYNNFQMINLNSSKFLKMMKKRSTTNYYLGTPYGSIKDDPNIKVTEAGFTRPNGMKSGKKKRMNCAGFIGSIFRDAGADLTVVRQMGYSYGTANACNWVSFFNYSDVKKYKYRSVNSLLSAGRAEKGDIICRVPDKFDKEENHDYHMMVFWGSNGKQNRMWHSTIQGGMSCNQISPLLEQSYGCTYYLVKLER